MKKEFEAPELIVVEFDVEDIITASGDPAQTPEEGGSGETEWE